MFTAAQRAMPEWQTITLRTGGGPGGPRGAGARGGRPPEAASAPDRGRQGGTPAPVTLSVRERAAWPRTATTTLTLNPFTGDVLHRSGYADMNAAQQVRSWTRFLHTGEALGWGGQFIAGIACLGGVFLVYTGFALSWRRFFGKRRADPSRAAARDQAPNLVDVQ